jgi:hypothetical protein
MMENWTDIKVYGVILIAYGALVILSKVLF